MHTDTAAQSKQADTGRGQPVPGKNKKIARVVNVSLVALGVLLISVGALSLFGLHRFQTSLTALATTSLPSVVRSAASSVQINQLVVLAERMVHVQSDAERRMVNNDIHKQLQHIAGLSIDTSDSFRSAPQFAVLGNQLGVLNSLVEQRLQLEKSMVLRSQQLSDIKLEAFLLADETARTSSGKEREHLHDVFLGLLNLLSQGHDASINVRVVKVNEIQRVVVRDIAALRAALSAIPGNESRRLQRVTDKIEEIFLGENGLLPGIAAHSRVKSESVSVNNIVRSMMGDLSVAQVSLFNGLMSSAGDLVAHTSREMALFIQIISVVGAFSVMLALMVAVYFRKAFIVRLETLNRAVLDRVEGRQSAIAIEGTDEIATLARSFNYFATELGVSKDIAEASSRAKSEFLANMSHEIRTPMNAVLGFTRMALESDLTPTQRGYLKKTADSAELLLSIINDILDFSKIEAGKLSVESIPFDLPHTLEQVTSVCGAKAKAKGLVFSTSIDPDVPCSLLGDPLRILQVLNNLCDNAVKFTGKGAVRVAVSALPHDGQTALLRFSVSDEGIGLSPEQIHTLFQPFTQADSSTTRHFGGTGLGLTISKSLCLLMGGDLEVESILGKGSIFSFTLPLGYAPATAASAGGDTRDANGIDLKGKSLLLVEDNEINQEIALYLLEKTNAQVDVACTGEEALEKVVLKKYALVLMDIQMPGMDGITATRQIRAMEDPYYKQLPIIAMTAHAMEGDKRKSLESGMNDHVTKPLDPDLLYAAIRHWAAPQQS